ncbi:hypothetical protein N9K77_01800 [bacterium]|nr:hypothetical protein [bacterium]
MLAKRIDKANFKIFKLFKEGKEGIDIPVTANKINELNLISQIEFKIESPSTIFTTRKKTKLYLNTSSIHIFQTILLLIGLEIIMVH